MVIDRCIYMIDRDSYRWIDRYRSEYMVLRPYPNQTKVHKVSPLHDFLHSFTNPLSSSLMSQLSLTFEFKVKYFLSENFVSHLLRIKVHSSTLIFTGSILIKEDFSD